MKQKFIIYPHEEPLIAAAIKFGDWFIHQQETTNEQKLTVKKIQNALRILPEVTFELSGSYEFLANDVVIDEWNGKEPVPKGAERSWTVDYYQCKSSDGTIRAIVEFCNHYHPFPLEYYQEHAWGEFHLNFCRESREINMRKVPSSEYQPSDWERKLINDWIQATSCPEIYRRDDVNFEVDIYEWTPSWLS